MSNRFRLSVIRVLACMMGVVLVAGCGKKEEAAAIDPAGSLLQPGRKIIIGVDEQFPPIVSRDGSGKLIGHDIDLAIEAFRRMGIQAEHRAVNWGNKDDMLLTKKVIDVLWSGVNISDARKKSYDFSEPYLSNRQVVIVPMGSSINSISNLNGKIVGVQAGTSVKPRLETLPGGAGAVAKTVDFPEYAAILVALMQGKVDAAVMGDVALPSYMQNTPGKFRVLDGDLGETQMGVATRKGDQQFIAKLNETLAAMKADGTIQKIDRKWFPDRK